MFFSLDTIIQWLVIYKYLLLFPIAVLEGPIISVIVGFLVSGHLFNLWIAYSVLVVADLVGDTMYYFIGFWGGKPFVRRWGYLFGLSVDKLTKAEQAFKDHPKKLLFFSKTQAWGSVVLATAGLVKMPYWKFLWANFIVTLFKSGLLMLVGYYAGESYAAIDRDLKYLGIFMTIFVAIIIVGIVVWKKYRPNRPPSEQAF